MALKQSYAFLLHDHQILEKTGTSKSMWSLFAPSHNLKRHFRSYAAVGILLAAAQLINIAFGLLSEEPVWIIGILLKGYQKTIAYIFEWLVDGWFPALVKKIAGLIGWNIELFPNWRDVVALLTLYLASHVGHALAVPNPVLAIMIRSLAGIVALVLAIGGASVLHASGLPQLVSIFSACLIGIATYRIGFAAQFAFDLRESGFWSNFRDKASGVITIVLGGLIIALSSLLTIRISPSEAVPGLQVVFLFLLVLFFGIYHVWAAVYSDWRKHRQLGAEARERISKTGHYSIGVRILLVWVGAILPILMNGLA